MIADYIDVSPSVSDGLPFGLDFTLEREHEDGTKHTMVGVRVVKKELITDGCVRVWFDFKTSLFDWRARK